MYKVELSWWLCGEVALLCKCLTRHRLHERWGLDLPLHPLNDEALFGEQQRIDEP